MLVSEISPAHQSALCFYLLTKISRSDLRGMGKRVSPAQNKLGYEKHGTFVIDAQWQSRVHKNNTFELQFFTQARSHWHFCVFINGTDPDVYPLLSWLRWWKHILERRQFQRTTFFTQLIPARLSNGTVTEVEWQFALTSTYSLLE